MQLVSAVKMRKAQQLAIEGRPYREILESIIRKVLPIVDESTSSFLKAREDAIEKELVIVISSNKGLCGAFNVNIFRLLLRSEDIKNADFITVGKKGAVFITSSGKAVLADFSVSAPLNEVSAIFRMALNNFLEGKYQKVWLVYNKFISTLRSESVREQLLPIQLRQEPGAENQELGVGGQKSEARSENSEVDYLIEPSKNVLFESLLKNFLEEKIRGAIINSEAAEHSSRMIAMKNATDNATEVIYNLTLLRNKLRQQKITYELLDMITAKESVETN